MVFWYAKPSVRQEIADLKKRVKALEDEQTLKFNRKWPTAGGWYHSSEVPCDKVSMSKIVMMMFNHLKLKYQPEVSGRLQCERLEVKSDNETNY